MKKAVECSLLVTFHFFSDVRDIPPLMPVWTSSFFMNENHDLRLRRLGIRQWREQKVKDQTIQRVDDLVTH